MKNLQKTDIDNCVDLILRAQKGDIGARNQVIENSLSLIKKIAARSIQSSSIPNSDLIQEGIFGLLTAIEKFTKN